MESMTSPFFTVIIPTYNRAELVKVAIESVLEQTFGNFELIVVNDHSIDNTKEAVASFQDSRIKYIVNDHTKGLPGARNASIFRAKGEWVAFLDDDDVWLPQKLELLYKKIQEVDHTVGLIYTGSAIYDFDKKQEISLQIPEKKGWIQNELLYENCVGSPSVVAIRTDILKNVSGCDESIQYSEDRDLYVRIAGLYKIDFIREKLTYIRTSNKDRLAFKLDKRLLGHLQFWEKHREIINKDPRLRHRAASRVFVFAVVQGNLTAIFKTLPWTLAGLLFDLPNCVWTFRNLLANIYRKTKQLINKDLL